MPRARKPRSARPCAPCPYLAPDKTLRFVELPAGQDPDDLVNGGGREAVEALLAAPEPLDARLWRHELEAQPLTTPRSPASALKQRLLDHARAIGHGDLGRAYRDQWLERFDREIAPRRSFEPRQRGPWRPFKAFEPPVGSEARGIAATGIDAPTARALILGFANFPEELPAHCEALAELAIPDRRTAHLRDELVNAAIGGTTLDRAALATILGVDGNASSGAHRAMGFSFTRRDSDPERARSDLAAALEIIAARQEVGQALHAATERLKEDTSDELLSGTTAPDRGATRIKGEAGTAGRHRLSGITMAKTESQDVDTNEAGDAPLIDLNDAQIKKLIARAKKRGVVDL